MRKLLFLLPLITLLTACQSKKEICARWAGNQITSAAAAQQLGLKVITDEIAPEREFDCVRGNPSASCSDKYKRRNVKGYCQFYTSLI